MDPESAAATSPISLSTTLADFFEQRYVLERDIQQSTADNYRFHIRKFGRWLGRAPLLSDFSDPVVNGYVCYVCEHPSVESARGAKRALVAIWNYAVDSDLPLTPHRRLRKLKREQKVIQGWTREELASLLRATRRCVGWFSRKRFCGERLERAAFWTAYCLTAYDTGLRLGDLMKLRPSDITGPGRLVVVQHKTRKVVETGISEEAWQAIRATKPETRETIFNVLERRSFFIAFRKLVESAGIKGTGKYLRRTSGSEVEKLSPGAGHLHLGHCDASIFDRHYNVRTITARPVILPPGIDIDGTGIPPARSAPVEVPPPSQPLPPVVVPAVVTPSSTDPHALTPQSTLMALIERMQIERPTKMMADVYRMKAFQFGAFLDRPALISDLIAERVSGFLATRVAGYAAGTQSKERSDMMTLCHFAADLGLISARLSRKGVRSSASRPASLAVAATVAAAPSPVAVMSATSRPAVGTYAALLDLLDD